MIRRFLRGFVRMENWTKNKNSFEICTWVRGWFEHQTLIPMREQSFLRCGDKRVLLSICIVSVCVGLRTTHAGRFHITSSIIQYLQTFSVYIQIGIVPFLNFYLWYCVCVRLRMMDTNSCGDLREFKTLDADCPVCPVMMWVHSPCFFTCSSSLQVTFQKGRSSGEDEGHVRDLSFIWDKLLGYSGWLTLCVWAWPGQGSNSDCLSPGEWAWPGQGRGFDWRWLCERVSNTEPAGDSRGSEWGSRTPPKVRRSRTGMRGQGRWRRSGAAGRRRGTWGGWSGDATGAPRCSCSASSSRCSPSRRTRGGWHSPLTAACRWRSTEGADFSMKRGMRDITYHITGQSEGCDSDGDTWRRLGSSESEPSGLHSAAAELGPSPQGARSSGPAQK